MSMTVPLDDGWRFGRYTPGSEEPGFDDGGLATVTVPHTVTPLSWRNWDPNAWEGTWIYRNRFDAPPTAASPGSGGARVFLDFDGAMTHAKPTLNGNPLPDHLGGYLPFSREVTSLLRPAGNTLAVVLDSSFNLNVPPSRPAPHPPESVDYWQPGGLYRRVWLRVVPPNFLADVFARPVDVLDPSRRRVVVECTIDAADVPSADASVTVELRAGSAGGAGDAGGRTISSAAAAVMIREPGQVTATATLDGLADIDLWDVGDPNLYTVVATLTAGGTPVHEKRVRIGFREAEFRLDGFYLNGRRLQVFGVNRHQHYPFAGAAMCDRAQRKDAEIIRRELNCTMVRCAHYPQAEAFFDACDELGLMAWEEAPGWGYLGDDDWKELVVRDVGDMVRRDRNHPSIIIWGARINETDDDVDLYTRTRDLAHRLDGSRQTAGAMAGRLGTRNYVQDVFAEDDYSSGTASDGTKQPELDPASPRTDRPYLISEAVGTLSGPARFYRRTDEQWVQQGQALAHARMHDLAGADQRYCGVIAWTGIDYESGAGKNTYQAVKYTGVVDLFRVPKPGAAIYAAQADPRRKPVIAPAFYWDFGPSSPVTGLSEAMICSNLDRLELWVGGVHHATVTPDAGRYPHLPCPPSFADFRQVDGSALPELRIDGYLGDELAASRTFSSDPATDELSLVADDRELAADGVDATRVAFRALDRYGAPRPYVGGQVDLTVDGPALLVGDTPFDFAAAGGAGAAWIRTLPGSGGTITVTAAHPVLGTATATITARDQSRKSLYPERIVAPAPAPPFRSACARPALGLRCCLRVARCQDGLARSATVSSVSWSGVGLGWLARRSAWRSMARSNRVRASRALPSVPISCSRWKRRVISASASPDQR
ncbi:MAG: beta-galactosidase [Nocardiopsaceae bacterium]|nr:beta-galactosidase [Nocardiopsaceae bacterium]